MLCGSRPLFSHQLNCHHHQFQLTLQFYSSNCCKNDVFAAKRALNHLSSSPSLIVWRAASFPTRRFGFFPHNTGNRGSMENLEAPFVNCVHPTRSHPLSGCLSQNEDWPEPPSERLSPVAGGIVALGKFDALHIGHRELAIQASKVGVPFLLSFVGIAEVLGWEPRAPIVARCDRKRVLSTWAPCCGNIMPREFQIDFSKVRSLTPRQFVEKLSVELGVRGVVAGQNYRFGYRAAGDASDLIRLCEEYGMGAYVISSVMDKNQHPEGINCRDSKERGQVSSTRVRHALSIGDMRHVSELLGRPHRLVVNINRQVGSVSGGMVSAPKPCLLNLPPVEGSYENCCLLIDEKNVVPCRVTIEATRVHLELDKLGSCTLLGASQDSQLLGIDFGD